MSGLDPIPEENMDWDAYYRLYYDDDDSENKYTYTTPMAEGGYDPTETTDDRTPLIPGDDDDDGEWRDADLSQYPIPDEDDDTTNPFDPGASSTPAGGENIQMSTRLPTEKQGARGTAETSFITRWFGEDRPVHDSAVREELSSQFPNASLTELEFRYKRTPRSGGYIIEVRYHTSDKWYPLVTKSRGDLEKTLNTALPARIRNALGKSTDDEINENNAELQSLSQQEETQQRAF